MRHDDPVNEQDAGRAGHDRRPTPDQPADGTPQPAGDTALLDPHGPDDEPQVSRRAVTMVLSGALLSAMLLVIMLVPLPYAVQRPGPTVNTLGKVDGKPLIEVDGAKTYPTSGELRLTTVSVVGGPGYPVTAADVLAGWLAEDEVVLPVEAVFPDGTTREQIDEQSTAQMTSSQDNATVAALQELGYDVPMVLTVSGVAPGSGADGVVERGDVISSIQPEGEERTQIRSFSDLSAVLARTPAGTQVTLGVVRDGSETDLSFATMGHPDTALGPAETPPGSLLGVLLDPQVEMPVDVDFDIENIGGPSAGTMFALGIIDTLTPGEMTGGEKIAGTGTMDLAGHVGPIGGIRQKLVGAQRAGADWFLAPEGNCSEVVGHVPDGLRVVRVGTLGEARHAVDAIAAGDGGSMPTCEASAR
ncbi:PDZ domain-containing protein [Georgenia soli]|uniref:endopeptidase La n=1 Tax=Georgenia soli TaxID=638953 RepID=A0A2A9EPN8_9MICO|nr:PDZ domain-containing protein [Georgenia soli]